MTYLLVSEWHMWNRSQFTFKCEGSPRLTEALLRFSSRPFAG